MARERKKILYIITKSNWGGAQKYVYDLATALKKEAEVVVALGAVGETLKEKLEERGIRTHVVAAFERDINLRKEVKVFFELVRILRSERPDIVHVNSSKAGGLGACASRILRVSRIVFTAHGWAFKEPRSRSSRVLILFFSWLTAVFSHTTIVVSEEDKEAAQWMPFVSKKLITVHNGIGKQNYRSRSAARSALKKEYAPLTNIPPRSVWVGTISELSFNKGLSFLLYAIDELVRAGERIVCLVMGEGDEREKLQELIDRLNLREHVFLLGYVSGAAEYVTAFDIFTLTSVKEGHPYTILEAGAAGVPVVASAVGGIPDVIEDMFSGVLVKPRRPDEIAKALSFLVHNPDKRTAFGEQLKKRVNGDFSLESMVKSTQSVYQLSK